MQLLSDVRLALPHSLFLPPFLLLSSLLPPPVPSVPSLLILISAFLPLPPLVFLLPLFLFPLLFPLALLFLPPLLFIALFPTVPPSSLKLDRCSLWLSPQFHPACRRPLTLPRPLACALWSAPTASPHCPLASNPGTTCGALSGQRCEGRAPPHRRTSLRWRLLRGPGGPCLTWR